ncbi:uncharacterized protein DUF2516 [Kitasatospora cineracea]|uniref:Uncharacterized protein DUF2516 n=1 Tax=Kitasatospora cineracea TaxID=88074 RepID=A0A3N4SC49_9ACTN|nr:DUF2516 family protein [Kitasatospora cineracea]ROR43659.1 uncharacterized protein DUF2516 [Kitasatospora cineracea]RPE34004.1 uncharacterized protein DUF2516 [Kitasatospora cineracea]
MQILYVNLLNPLWWVATAIICFKVFALADAVFRREDAYRAADKKTKGFWVILLSVALAWDLLFGANPITGLLTLAGLVAAIVYVVDVRPAIKLLTDGRGGGRSNQGPYGPW